MFSLLSHVGLAIAPFIKTLLEYLRESKCVPRDELSRMFCLGDVPQVDEVPEGWVVVSALKNANRRDLLEWALERTDSYIVRRLAGLNVDSSVGWEPEHAKRAFDCIERGEDCSAVLEDLERRVEEGLRGGIVAPLDLYLYFRFKSTRSS